MDNRINIIQKIKTGSFWTFFGVGIDKVFSFAVMVILARTLSLSDFGIAAIAWVVLEFIQIWGVTGAGSKLIHQQTNIREYATAVFWLNLLVAGGIALITVAIATPVAAFYNSPLVQPVLSVLALGFIVSALGSTHATLLRKEMSFKKLSILEMSVNIVSSLFSVFMALTGFGVWSLILPRLCASPIRIVGLWRLHPWRPTRNFKLEYWKEIFDYGKFVFGTTVVRYFNVKGDNLIIGKLLGTEALGLYSFAYDLANWPVRNFVFMMSSVTFPAFSALQKDMDTLKGIYLKTIEMISLISFPCLIGLMAVADEFIPLVYGEKWVPAILPFKVIIVFALYSSIASVGGPLLRALGQPRKEFAFNFIQIGPLFFAIVIGAQYGIVGVAVGMSLTLSLFGILFLGMATKAIGLDLKVLARRILPGILSAVIMGICVSILEKSLRAQQYETMSVLLASIGIGIVIYPLVLVILFRGSAKSLMSLIAEMKPTRVAATD